MFLVYPPLSPPFGQQDPTSGPRYDLANSAVKGSSTHRENHSDLPLIGAKVPPPAKHHIKERKPKEFDSSKTEWKIWFSSFEMVAEWNGWTDDQKAKQLAMSMTGSAEMLVHSLDRDVRYNCGALVAALAKRYDEGRESACITAYL